MTSRQGIPRCPLLHRRYPRWYKPRRRDAILLLTLNATFCPACARAPPRNLQEVASEVDVLYQTRIQKERFGDRIADYEMAC